MATAKKTQHAEVLVIGADLTGLLIAEHLRQSGQNVRLFDGHTQLGVPHRPVMGKTSPLKSDLEFFPEHPNTASALQWMGNLLRTEIPLETIELGPVHFDEGLLRPFVGFGDRAFGSRDEIDFYSTPRCLAQTSIIAAQTQSLAQQWQERGHQPRQVTKLWVESGKISAVEFNGEEIWTADKIICTLGVSDLLELLPLDAIDGRNRTRLGKALTWASVSLHALHKTSISDERGLHILFGNGQEFEPIVGRVWAAEESGRQHSVWTTLVGKDFTDDSDQLGHALKHLKRQVRRVYPKAFEDLADEKVVVTPESHGHLALKTAETFSFPELAGFYLATPLLSPLKGALAAIDVASRVAQAMDKSLSPVPATTEATV